MLYEQLVKDFPLSGLKPMPAVGNKLSLNNLSSEFLNVIRSSEAWALFYNKAMTKAFIKDFQDIEYFPDPEYVKFEFSILPGAGGFIHPHPDTPKKLSTIVLYITDEVWPTEYGGGMQCYSHRTNPNGKFTGTYNEVKFSDVDVLMTAQYRPNTIVGFVRTDNSLHGVPPINHPKGLPRRSVTINFIKEKR